MAIDGDLEVWAKDMEDGTKAVGLFNRGEEATDVTAKWSDLGLKGKRIVRDLWRQKDLGKYEGEFKAGVAAARGGAGSHDPAQAKMLAAPKFAEISMNSPTVRDSEWGSLGAHPRHRKAAIRPHSKTLARTSAARWCVLLLIAAAVAWLKRPSRGRLRPVVEAEEDIYTYTNADNGAGPLWCHGSTCLVRIGDDVFASGLETLPDVKPLNNCRWTLYQRGKSGWQLQQADPAGRTREPSPAGGLSRRPALPFGQPHADAGGNLRRPGPAGDPAVRRPSDPKAPFERLLPVWDGTPAVHRTFLPQLRRRRPGPGVDPVPEHRLHARRMDFPRPRRASGSRRANCAGRRRGVSQARAHPGLLSERRCSRTARCTSAA